MKTTGPRLFRLLLEVDNLDQAVSFYTTLLATEGRAIRGGRHYFDCGEIILGLVDVSASGRVPSVFSEYIYFATAELNETHQRASNLGCLSDDDVHGQSAGEITMRPWGECSFYVEDPFGNRLRFVDEDTLFTGR